MWAAFLIVGGLVLTAIFQDQVTKRYIHGGKWVVSHIFEPIGQVLGAVTGPGWTWVWLVLTVVFLILTIILGIGIRLISQHLLGKWGEALDTLREVLDQNELAIDTIDLFTGLTLSVDNIIRAADPDDETRRVIETFLQWSHRTFGGLVIRTHVLVPRGEYLETLTNVRMPPPTHHERHFYIGQDADRRRGVAGYAFVTKEVQCAKLRDPADRFTFNHAEYLVLDPTNTPPGYKSFIVAPLMYSANRCMGVLCIDSADLDTFDNEAVRGLVFTIGVAIARTLVVGMALSEQRQGENLAYPDAAG